MSKYLCQSSLTIKIWSVLFCLVVSRDYFDVFYAVTGHFLLYYGLRPPNICIFGILSECLLFYFIMLLISVSCILHWLTGKKYSIRVYLYNFHVLVLYSCYYYSHYHISAKGPYSRSVCFCLEFCTLMLVIITFTIKMSDLHTLYTAVQSDSCKVQIPRWAIGVIGRRDDSAEEKDNWIKDKWISYSVRHL